MAKKVEFKRLKIFSLEFKKHIVQRIERGELTVKEAQREYDIKSGQTVYSWIYQYSRYLKKGTRIVIEMDSEQKKSEDLKKRIKELEAALGRKSLEADLYKTIVEVASKELKTDLKKNFGDKAFNK